MVRHLFATAVALLFVSVGESFADVTYSYVADQNAYSGVTGTMVSVNLYLMETVSTTGTNRTSLINRVFQDSTNAGNLFFGASSIGVAVEQTALSGGGQTSQIMGPSVVTPTGVSYNGVANNAGWTFAPDFTYNFTQNVSGTPVPMVGGSSASRLYQNVNDTVTGFNGNNLQVKVALTNQNSLGSVNQQNAEQTDALYNSSSDTYPTGKILIGTLNITVGKGTTTFQVRPLAGTAFTNSSSSTFNTLTNTGANGTGAGVTTLLSTSPAQTNLAVTIFGGVANPVNLDQSYTSDTRPHSATFDTYNSINSSFLNFPPTAGPDAKPTATSSFLPFYNADSTPFTFTVAAVPEPSSIALCGMLCVAGAGYMARRRRKNRE